MSLTINQILNISESDTLEVNENLCFNTKLLEEVRQYSPNIKDILEGYADLIYSEPMLIDLRLIHDLSPITNKFTNITKPNGFQIRANEAKNEDVVDKLAFDISRRKWQPRQMQGAVFVLPEEYMGQSRSSDGIERIYGIANLTHRYYAAIKSGETHIIAWVLKFKNLGLLRKWANAFANDEAYASNPRTNDDIIQSILHDLEDPDSDLKFRRDAAPTAEKRTEIMREEVETYNVSPKARDSIVRKLGFVGGFDPDRKRWDAEFMKQWISENYPLWVTSSDSNYDFITEHNTKVIIVQDEGRGVIEAAEKYATHILKSNTPVMILFSMSKHGKIDKSKASEIRNSFKVRVSDHIRKMGEAYNKLYVEKTSPLPLYSAFPEFENESVLIDLY